MQPVSDRPGILPDSRTLRLAFQCGSGRTRFFLLALKALPSQTSFCPCGLHSVFACLPSGILFPPELPSNPAFLKRSRGRDSSSLLSQRPPVPRAIQPLLLWFAKLLVCPGSWGPCLLVPQGGHHPWGHRSSPLCLYILPLPPGQGEKLPVESKCSDVVLPCLGEPLSEGDSLVLGELRQWVMPSPVLPGSPHFPAWPFPRSSWEHHCISPLGSKLCN